MDGQTDGRTNGRPDGSMDGWIGHREVFERNRKLKIKASSQFSY